MYKRQASYFSNFGSEVSVFQFDDTFLVREDEDESKIVKEILENKGVKFFFNTSVKRFEDLGDSVKAICVKDGQEFIEEDVYKRQHIEYTILYIIYYKIFQVF